MKFQRHVFPSTIHQIFRISYLVDIAGGGGTGLYRAGGGGGCIDGGGGGTTDGVGRIVS